MGLYWVRNVNTPFTLFYLPCNYTCCFCLVKLTCIWKPGWSHSGAHDGAAKYTIGQGIKLSGLSCRYFVTRKLKNGDLIVAPGRDHPELYSTSVMARDIHWIQPTYVHSKVLSQAQSVFCLMAQVRYRQDPVPCKITKMYVGRRCPHCRPEICHWPLPLLSPFDQLPVTAKQLGERRFKTWIWASRSSLDYRPSRCILSKWNVFGLRHSRYPWTPLTIVLKLLRKSINSHFGNSIKNVFLFLLNCTHIVSLNHDS
jgi:hypothetical protein